MSKTNILTGAALAAALVVILGPALSMAASRGSAVEACSWDADRTQRASCARWRDARGALQSGADVDAGFDRGRCRYVGGPKSSTPCW
jgi:hypothetical protein